MTRDEYNNGGAYIVARHGEQCATRLTAKKAGEILARIEKRRELTRQARELSNPSLGEKFGMHHKSISRIVTCLRGGIKPYRDVTLADYALIRECAAERHRLRQEAALHSDASLAKEYGTSKSLVCGIGMGTRWVRI
tara:strand:- start:673 stop:1083 length:411 start_codon:yes stop_codon:yes gene_type:complete